MSRSGHKMPGYFGPPPLTCWCCGARESQSGCVRGLPCRCTPLLVMEGDRMHFSEACKGCFKCAAHCTCPPLAEGEYRCAMCRQVYQRAISDEEAMAETQSYWPDVTKEQCRIVCDDCWEKIKPEEHPQQYAESLKEMA